MALYSRYFHSDLPPGSRTTCHWGMCFYPIGAYWNYGEYHRITLTLTSASGSIDNMSMYSWTGTLPSVTPVTAENFLDMGSSPAVGHSATADFPPGSDGFTIEIKAADSAYPLDVRIDFDMAPGDVGYCQYGTRLQAGQQTVALISEAAIAAAAVLVPELAFLSVAWGALVGMTWVPGTVCGGPPPQMPVFGPDDFVFGTRIPAPGSLSKFLTAFEATVWPLYCECLPATGGGPTPVEYPPAPGDRPKDTPGSLTPIVCSNEDICSTLDRITYQLTALSLQLSLARADIQLIQRQHVPFGTRHGSLHSGLTGAGTFAVQGVIGLAITVTAAPGYLSADMETPPETFKFGDLTLGTADGYLRKIWIVKSPQLVDEIEGDITIVAYDLEPGVTVDARELIREL